MSRKSQSDVAFKSWCKTYQHQIVQIPTAHVNECLPVHLTEAEGLYFANVKIIRDWFSLFGALAFILLEQLDTAWDLIPTHEPINDEKSIILSIILKE